MATKTAPTLQQQFDAAWAAEQAAQAKYIAFAKSGRHRHSPTWGKLKGKLDTARAERRRLSALLRDAE